MIGISMKRSEMVEHIEADLLDMLDTIKLRPNAAKHQPNIFANDILDMIEGFGMLPPPHIKELPETDTINAIMLNEWEAEDGEK